MNAYGMAVEGDLIERLMHLPDRDRADVARQLLISLEGAEQTADLDEAWEAEIERRLAAFDRDETIAVDWQESMQRARAAIRGVPGNGG
jgi:putative addiction module component (TIGR02574 family)